MEQVFCLFNNNDIAFYLSHHITSCILNLHLIQESSLLVRYLKKCLLWGSEYNLWKLSLVWVFMDILLADTHFLHRFWFGEPLYMACPCIINAVFRALLKELETIRNSKFEYRVSLIIGWVVSLLYFLIVSMSDILWCFWCWMACSNKAY